VRQSKFVCEVFEVHYAKIAFEKYFLRKIRRGESEPFYERFVLDRINLRKTKETV